MNLRGSDARKLLAVVSDLADITDEPLIPAVLGELHRVLPGEAYASNTVTDPVGQQPEVEVVITPDHTVPDAGARVRPHLADDPFVTRFIAELASPRPGPFVAGRQPLRISDLVPTNEWTSTDLYNTAYRPFSLLHQVAGVVDVRGARVRSCAVLRGRRDFTENDCDIFAVLMRELGRLHRRHDERARLRTLAAAAYETAEHGVRPVAAVGMDGTVLPLNATAAELLTDRDLGRNPRLRQLITGSAGRPCATVIHVQIAATSLRVEVVPSSRPDLRCLLVFHNDGHRSVARRYHLTNRERDVLGLLGTGQTADAVARRLGLSPRTVQKYLERVYSKLEVSDRLSAVLRAQQLGILAEPE